MAQALYEVLSGVAPTENSLLLLGLLTWWGFCSSSLVGSLTKSIPGRVWRIQPESLPHLSSRGKYKDEMESVSRGSFTSVRRKAPCLQDDVVQNSLSQPSCSFPVGRARKCNHTDRLYHWRKCFKPSHRGSTILPVTSTSGFGPLYWVASSTTSGTYYVKLANYGTTAQSATVKIPGATGASATANLIVLPGASRASNYPNDVTVQPTSSSVTGSASGV